MNFLTVYVREAHPTDGWRMPSNDKVGVTVAQPQNAADRTKVAGTCCALLNATIPILVDTLDDRVGHAYSGMPDRLYVIDTAGRVAYKGGRGPFGFKPAEMEQSLLMLLLDEAAPKTSAFVPLLDNAATWKLLPPAEAGAGAPLPSWARALAKSLPDTTAAMLELDYRHRALNPVGSPLRAKMRWVAAHANRCLVTQAVAAADLRRAGATDKEIAALAGDLAALPEVERLPLQFARKLTLAADTVTDAEMAALIRDHGEKNVVAMVQLLAHANFQDRLVLALGLPPEADPPAPLNVRFKRRAGLAASLRPPAPAQPSVKQSAADTEWKALGYPELQKRLEQQRQRPGRIRVPTWDEVAKTLPPAARSRGPLRIQWSLVCSGYQPELAAGWSACTGSFGKESGQDRVFQESLFWVVTRTLQCFY